MSRGVGATESFASALAPFEPLLALLTQLGDPWFLALLGTLAYWFGARTEWASWDGRRGLLVLAVACWAFAATQLLKGVFAFPRPVGAGEPAYAVGGALGAVYADAATAHGLGFPSGHAIGAAAVYGTVAWLGPADRRRRRLPAAGAVILLVAFTRLGLGLHYLVDVVAGAAVGLALAAVAVRLRDGPAPVFALAGVTVAGRFLVGPVTVDTWAIAGLPVGALVGIWLAGAAGGRERTTQSVTSVAVPGIVALVAGLGLLLLGVPGVGGGLGAVGGAVLAVGLPAVLWPEKMR